MMHCQYRQRTAPRISLRRAYRLNDEESVYDKIDMYYHRDSCHIELTNDEDLLRECLENAWRVSLSYHGKEVLEQYMLWCKSKNIFLLTKQATDDLSKAHAIFNGTLHGRKMKKVITKLKVAIARLNPNDVKLLERVFNRHCVLRDLTDFEWQISKSSIRSENESIT